MRDFKNHDLVDDISKPGVRYELRPATLPDGTVADGLYNAWITLDNQAHYNSYTTDMVKGVILAKRAASNARDVSSVVFTGAGDKAFCTGGDVKEYATIYTQRPRDYWKYMGLFSRYIEGILRSGKVTIARNQRHGRGRGQRVPARVRPRRDGRRHVRGSSRVLAHLKRVARFTRILVSSARSS